MKRNEPGSDFPEPPDYIDDLAKDFWRKACRELDSIGLLPETNLVHVAQYAQCLSDWARLSKIARDEGMVLKNKSKGGNTVGCYNPTYSAANNALQQSLRIANLIGLSMKERKVTPKNKPDAIPRRGR